MYLIDTHSHISHFPKEDQEAIINRAETAGVKKLINVSCDLNQIIPHTQLANAHENIWSSAGIHPTSLNDDLEGSMAKIHEFARNEDKIVAIGEIGLDYYHNKFSHDVQDEWFTRQLDIARDLGLPAIIHCRGGKNPGENSEAFLDLIRILNRKNFDNGVIHCFSGNMIEAEKIIDMGLMISFTGIITYKNNEDLREVVKMVPLNSMMLETDCPYLTVESHRGQSGEPAFMREIVEKVSEIKGVPVNEVIEQLRINTEKFFRI